MKKTAVTTRPPVGEKSPSKAKKTPRARLLLVEDNDSTRGTLQKLLVDLNFDVSAASTVAGAWALVADSKFDVLLSDIGLPDGTASFSCAS